MSHLIGRRNPREAYPVRSSALPSALAQPLTAEFWVDSGTSVPVAQRNGSILAPFGSLQDAYDAAVAAGLTAVNMMIAKSDAAASLNCSAGTVFVSLVGLSGPLGAIASSPSFQQQVNNLTISGAAVSLMVDNVLVQGDISAPDGAPLTFENVEHLGDLNAPTSPVFVSKSVLCGAGTNTCAVASINFLDAFSEGRMMAASAHPWASGTIVTSTNAGTGANIAETYDNADVASETFTGQSRRIWPANTISVARTVTLLPGGAGDFATGYIDVYSQGSNVVIQNDLGVLWTIAPGSPAMRYGFVLPDAAHWVKFSAEILGV